MIPSNHLPLPYDILSTIFQKYVEDAAASSSGLSSQPRRDLGPILVSHVCQYWRDVAFSTPTIWSTLTIDSRLSYPLISHFLTLAREAPLSLYVFLWSFDGNRSDPRVLDLLLSRMTRWRSIGIWFDEDTAKDILQRFDEGHGAEVGCVQMYEPSILEKAIIEGGVFLSTETSKRIWQFFLDQKRFPLLRQLHCSMDLGFMGSLDLRDFNWEKLTHLLLSSPPPMTECLLLLQRCKNLRSLNIDFRRTSVTSLPPYSRHSMNILEAPIIPPNSLRELTIQVEQPVTGRLLSQFTKSYLDSGNFVVDVRV